MSGEALARAPAAARNQAPILAVLRRHLPDKGVALEIASGTGQHAAAFAGAFPEIDWQPSDPNPEARHSIAAWRAQSNLTNLRAPLSIDVSNPDWETALPGQMAAILCINMIHIAPWAAGEGLIRGAGEILSKTGLLFFYGPFRRDGSHTAPSNAEFDRALRAQNPEWGVRDMEAVTERARAAGLELAETVAMPANNLSLIFRRRA